MRPANRLSLILTGTNVSLRIETRCRHLSANKPSFLRPVIRPQLSDSKHLFKNLFNVRRDAAK